MVDRVATSSMHQQNLRDISKVQLNLANLNKQISSGKKASTYDELSGIVERVSGYQSKISSIDTYLSNNKSILSRLSLTDQAITQVQKVAEEFSSLVSLRRSGNGASLNFASQAQSMLDIVAQQLNVNSEGRYIFSGSKTDTAPITTPIPNPSSWGTADANYYAGNNEVLKANISDSLEMEYGVLGSDTAFQNLITSIKTAIKADSINDDNYFMESVDLVNVAIEELAKTRAGVNSNINNLNNINDQHESLKLYWKEALGNDTSTDIAEASIQLSVDQTVLQATFQAFAGLSKLRLTDYL